MPTWWSLLDAASVNRQLHAMLRATYPPQYQSQWFHRAGDLHRHAEVIEHRSGDIVLLVAGAPLAEELYEERPTKARSVIIPDRTELTMPYTGTTAASRTAKLYPKLKSAMSVRVVLPRRRCIAP